MKLKLALVAVAAVLPLAAPASAAIVPIGTTIVPGTAMAGVTQILGPIADGDTLSFSVSDTPYLHSGPSYGTNAAGVVTVFGQESQTAVGGSLPDTVEGLGFTYGALIATLNGVSRQVFATSADNGLGSSAPPTTLTFSGTVASLFGANIAGATNILNFRVDDSDSGNNAGFFTVTGAAAGSGVPESATWAMMIAGIGMIGVAMRGRRKVGGAVSLA